MAPVGAGSGVGKRGAAGGLHEAGKQRAAAVGAKVRRPKAAQPAVVAVAAEGKARDEVGKADEVARPRRDVIINRETHPLFAVRIGGHAVAVQSLYFTTSMFIALKFDMFKITLYFTTCCRSSGRGSVSF